MWTCVSAVVQHGEGEGVVAFGDLGKYGLL